MRLLCILCPHSRLIPEEPRNLRRVRTVPDSPLFSYVPSFGCSLSDSQQLPIQRRAVSSLPHKPHSLSLEPRCARFMQPSITGVHGDVHLLPVCAPKPPPSLLIPEELLRPRVELGYLENAVSFLGRNGLTAASVLHSHPVPDRTRRAGRCARWRTLIAGSCPPRSSVESHRTQWFPSLCIAAHSLAHTRTRPPSLLTTEEPHHRSPRAN